MYQSSTKLNKKELLAINEKTNDSHERFVFKELIELLDDNKRYDFDNFLKTVYLASIEFYKEFFSTDEVDKEIKTKAAKRAFSLVYRTRVHDMYMVGLIGSKIRSKEDLLVFAECSKKNNYTDYYNLPIFTKVREIVDIMRRDVNWGTYSAICYQFDIDRLVERYFDEIK